MHLPIKKNAGCTQKLMGDPNLQFINQQTQEKPGENLQEDCLREMLGKSDWPSPLLILMLFMQLLNYQEIKVAFTEAWIWEKAGKNEAMR